MRAHVIDGVRKVTTAGIAERRLRADATRNRAAILSAAEEAFARQGATATTSDIAHRAGVAVGTIFRHFPSKTDLLAAVLTGVLERLRARAAAIHLDDPETGLRVFFREVLVEASAQNAILSAFHAETGMPLSRGVNGLRDAVSVLVDDGHRAGVLRGSVSRVEVMALLVALAEGAQRAHWDQSLQRRVLSAVFAGFTP